METTQSKYETLIETSRTPTKMESRSTIQHEKLPDARTTWTVLNKLGEGTYGEVYRAKCVNSNEDVAVKIIRLESEDATSEFENELSILEKVCKQQENLPNFIGLYGDITEMKIARLWFVMELCELGPINHLLKQIDEKTLIVKLEKEKLIAYALQGTLKALKYLHQSGIMHRDVKGSHILVTKNYIIKLIDFGVANLFNETKAKRNSSVGTSLWMSPEIIACAHQLEYEYDERCDIWSLGITAIELADGEAPLAHLHPTKVLFEIPRRPPPTFTDKTEWSEKFCQFVTDCLVKDYEHRPHAERLLIEENFVNFDENTSVLYRTLLEHYHKKILSDDSSHNGYESDQSTTVNDDRDEMNINPWIANISKSGDLIDNENNLARIDFLDETNLINSIRRRFTKTLIYTFIGDVLLAINPKQFLPIDNLNFQLKYSKIRQDLLPHVFAIATKVYNQMMINHQRQCIILSGESGAGKTHAAQNLINELSLLGFGEQRILESRLVTMNLLLETFGNAQTELNNNSSRFGKLLDIFFSEYGTIVYVQLSQFLLEKTRVVLASGNTRNFHIFYSIYSHFSQHQTISCTLNDSESFELFQSIKYYTYLGNHNDQTTSSLSLINLFQILKELNVTDDEQSSILAVLASIIHLGNVSFKAHADINDPGCSIDEQSKPHFNAVYRLLNIDNEQFEQALCQSSLMARGETVTKLNTVAEAQQTRDAMAKSLYSRLFDWIVFALNRYFRTELEYKPKSIVDIRKQHEQNLLNKDHDSQLRMNGDSEQEKLERRLCSISILDLFGFETFDCNSYEQLCINIANEQLQYFYRQHTFAWEMKEYENEDIQKAAYPDNFDFPNNRSILDMCLSKPIGLLALLDEESRFPQSTELTLVQKWRENLKSPHFSSSTPSSTLSRKSLKQRQQSTASETEPFFTICHYAGKIEYTAKDFLEKNRDYVPMEIIDLLLQSEDHLVNLLFRSRLRKTGSVIYTEQDKQDKSSSLFRSAAQKTTTRNRTQGTVSTYFRYSLMELVSTMASAQPTFIRCLVPNRLAFQSSHVTYDHTSYFPHNFVFDSSQFDEAVVLEQIRYSGLIETISMRRNGYSHRIVFNDFISNYSCLIHLNPQSSMSSTSSKEMCEIILKKFRHTDYAIGKTKVFLKFHHVEQLNIAHKILLSKLIRLQSHIRMHLATKQIKSLKKGSVKSQKEQKIVRIQALVRGYLSRRDDKRRANAVILIQAYFRMWYERSRYKDRLLLYKNQLTHASFFLKQVELFGNSLYQQLVNLDKSNESSEDQKKDNPSESNTKLPVQPQSTLPMAKKQSCIIFNEYYDKVYKEFVSKKCLKFTDETKPEQTTETTVKRPSTAPAMAQIPEAPPCPPPDFFQAKDIQVKTFHRQKSAPATVAAPINELKQLFAKKQSKQAESVLSSFEQRHPSLSSLNITVEDNDKSSSNSSNVNHSDSREKQTDCQPRRLLSSSSSIVRSRSTGLVTCSTSTLVGDMSLTSDNVLILKKRLRKTGLVENNRTLRRKLPAETIQVDFRSVLRPSKNHLNITDNRSE